MRGLSLCWGNAEELEKTRKIGGAAVKQPTKKEVARLGEDLLKIITRTRNGFPALWGAAAAKTADEIAPALGGDWTRAQEIAAAWSAIQESAQRIRKTQPETWQQFRLFLFRLVCSRVKMGTERAIADFAHAHGIPEEEARRAAMVPQMIAADILQATKSSLQSADHKKQTAISSPENADCFLQSTAAATT